MYDRRLALGRYTPTYAIFFLCRYIKKPDIEIPGYILFIQIQKLFVTAKYFFPLYWRNSCEQKFPFTFGKMWKYGLYIFAILSAIVKPF